jgi:hypothetical protein
MITIEKLNIYKRYEGDEDMFARAGRTSQQQLFDNNDWSSITDCEQNIELIAKGMASIEFRNKTLQELQKNFDSDAFLEITKPISEIILGLNGYTSEQQKQLELVDKKQNEKAWWKFWA